MNCDIEGGKYCGVSGISLFCKLIKINLCAACHSKESFIVIWHLFTGARRRDTGVPQTSSILNYN